MAKPASKPDWTVGNPDFATVTQEPTNTKKEAGWLPDERPPREYMNWLFFNIHEWIEYFEGATDGLLLQLGQFDAVVGFGGTHATINDLMGDPGIATLKNVLITNQSAPAVNQVINQPGMNFTFKPQAAIIGGGGATIGLTVDAVRVRIFNARMTGFNGGGEVGLRLTANAKNCLVSGCMFNDDTTTLDDLGANNSLIGNIEEIP